MDVDVMNLEKQFLCEGFTVPQLLLLKGQDLWKFIWVCFALRVGHVSGQTEV